jgi:hypothetical protein
MRTFSVAPLLFACACGGGGAGDGDASPDASADVTYGHKPIDASSTFDVVEEEAAPTPWDRMEAHQGIVLHDVGIYAIYVGTQGIDLQIKNWDTFLAWLVTSTDYWSLLAQYNVGAGTFLGSTTIPTSTFFEATDIDGEVVDADTVATRLREAVATLSFDGGVAPTAYIVFLPANVNVNLGDDGITCAYAEGYHTYDAVEPFAVIPACGAFGIVVSHEMAEMSTDPIPGAGWYSNDDVNNAGGEVGDLCNVPIEIDGNVVTELWSNADGECEPQ